MQKLSRFFAVVLFMVFCMGASSIAEEITLTTYYPSPEGNYNQLQADEHRATKLAVGSLTTMPTTDGDLEASGTVTAEIVQTNTVFNVGGTDDGVADETFDVVTDLQKVGLDLEVTKKTITVKGGIITDISVDATETLPNVF